MRWVDAGQPKIPPNFPLKLVFHFAIILSGAGNVGSTGAVSSAQHIDIENLNCLNGVC